LVETLSVIDDLLGEPLLAIKKDLVDELADDGAP
jgi:hypothetical protein